MSTFAVDGLVSGLDTASLVSQLMQLEAVPKARLQTKVVDHTTDIRAYQNVAAAMKKIEDAVAEVTKAQTWTGVKAAVTGDAVTATARTGASTGSLAIQVSSLATQARWTFADQAGLDTAATFTAGTQLSFTKGDGTQVSVATGSGSIRDVMDSINATEGLGARAVAVRVGPEEYRLQITSTGTGATGATRLTNPEALDPGFDPATGRTGGTDAAYTINGIAGTSPTNSVTNLVSGVDVVLTKVGEATVGVATDTAATKAAIEKLVAATNEALAVVKVQTATDPGLSTRGPLASDSMVRAITGRVLQAVGDGVGGISAATIGLQTTREGTLKLDTAVLDQALAANPAGVRAMFSPVPGPPVPVDPSDPGGPTVPAPVQVGIAERLRSIVDSATSTSNGFLTNAVQGRESSKKDLETQILSWDRRLETRKTALQKQFAGLEVALGRLQSQGSWLSGQLAGLQNNRA